MTARDNSNDALEKEVNDTKEIEEFLKWYLDSYDDFFSRGRWGGAGSVSHASNTLCFLRAKQ